MSNRNRFLRRQSLRRGVAAEMERLNVYARGRGHLEELESRLLLAVLTNSGTADDRVYDVTAGADQLEIRWDSGSSQLVFDSANGTFDDTFEAMPGTLNSLTINLLGGADTITLKDLRGSPLDNKLTIAGGLGNDTFLLDDNWGIGVRLTEGVELGSVDTIDLAPFSGVISIQPQLSGSVGVSTVGGGPDNSSLTIPSASALQFESLIHANIDLTTTARNALVGGLHDTVEFARRLAEYGELATSLPLIGSNAEVAVGKALDVAESIDQLRLKVESFLQGLPSVTTGQLESALTGFAKALDHLGPAQISPQSSFSIAGTDVYGFLLSLDGGPATNISVDIDTDIGLNPADYTTAKLAAKLNEKLATANLADRLLAVAMADGRVAMQVVGREVKSFGLTGAGQSVTKLGFPIVESLLTDVDQILRDLGDLNVNVSGPVTTAVKFEGGLPKLRMDVDYRANRTSDFSYDFGDEATSFGMNFDVAARITAEAALVLDFALGLDLTTSGVDYFIDVDDLRAGIRTSASAVSDLGLNVGFLDASVDGTLEFEAGVSVNPSDPNGVITRAQLASSGIGALVSSLSLTDFDPTDGGGDTGPVFDVDLDLAVDAGLSSLGGFAATATVSASGNPFDGSNIDLNVSGDFDEFLNFNNLNAAGVVSLLGQVSSWLDGVRNGQLIEGLQIPVVSGGLDQVLAFAEVFSDALLFNDGSDDAKDGANKLITDINAALASAGIDSFVRAQGEGGKVTFIAVDPQVTAFSIANVGLGAAFTQLGLTDGAASLNPQGVLRRIGSVVSPFGKLTAGDSDIQFSITRNGETQIKTAKVTKASTDNNVGVGDDLLKLLDASNATTFKSAQQLAKRLTQIVSLGDVEYDSGANQLTYTISFTDVPLFSVELPTDFSLNLAPVGDVQSNTRLIIDAKGGIALTLGFDLSETIPGASEIDGTTTLADLEVSVKDEPAMTAGADPRTIVGRLSGDAKLDVTITGGAKAGAYKVTIPASSTSSNQFMSDLIADVTAALQAAVPNPPGPAVDLTTAINAVADGNRVKLIAVEGAVTGFQTATTSADPAFRDLGFQQSQVAARDDSNTLFVKTGKDAPAQVGVLSAEAGFSIQINGGAVVPVTVTAAATAQNRNILDLVTDVQNALDSALEDASVAEEIDVSSEGQRLLFTLAGASSGSFTITPGTNATQLGLPSAIASDEADLLITLSNGATTYRVTLDGATTITDVINAIDLQTSHQVAAAITVDDPVGDPTPVNEAGSGLTLFDVSGTTGNSFKVDKVNGSLAGLKLGIVGADVNPVDPDDDADQTIVGATIAGASLLDRFYITAPDLDHVVTADLDVSAGLVVSGITVLPGSKITSSKFAFRDEHQGKQLVIKDIAGFTVGAVSIVSVNEGTNEATLSAPIGPNGLTGGVGILKTGVDAGAHFGFVGINLTGEASLGAQLSLGFNTSAPELADSRLSLEELINGLDHITSLLAPPDISPPPGETDFGGVDLQVGIDVNGSPDFASLAAGMLGASPSLSVTVVTLGDPLLGIRFSQANYNQLTTTQFEVDGDFTSKLPDGVKMTFDGDTFEVVSTSYAPGPDKTTVTVAPEASATLPSDLTGVDVVLEPKIDLTHTDLDDLTNFQNLTFDDLIVALQSLAGFLGQFEAFGFLNQPLPLVNKSVNDLLSYADDLADAFNDAKSNPSATLQFLESKLKESIGISQAKINDVLATVGLPPGVDVVNLSLVDGSILRFDLTLGASFSRGLDLQIPGIDFGSALSSVGLGSLLDLAGSAGLSANGAIAFTLGFGVDVTSPGSGLYVFDNTGVDAHMEVAGTDISFRAGLGPFSLSVATFEEPGTTINSEVVISADAGAHIKPAVFGMSDRVLLSTIVGDLGGSIDTTLTGQIEGALPVFFPNDANHIGTIRIGDSANINSPADLANIGNLYLKSDPLDTPPVDSIVIDVSPVVDAVSNFNFDNFDLFSNIFLAIDGLDSLLETVQDVMDGQIGGFSFPLIGEDLAKGARFIENLREDFIAPLRQGVETTKDIAADFADPDKNIVSDLLYRLLGPVSVGGIGLLKQQSGAGDSPGDFIHLNTNLDDFLFNPNTTLELNDTFIEWDIKLGTVLADSTTDIGFDLGIPGLGLKTEGDITIDVEWEFDLNFGLSFEDGFYVDVSAPHELLFDVSVGLPAAGITGTLGFLELRAEDTTLDVLGDDRNTELGAIFYVDIYNDSNPADDKLSFTEFGSMAFDAGIAAEAAATLELQLGISDELIGDIFGGGAGDVVAGFPKLAADFVFLWELGSRGSGATLEQRASASDFVSFSDIETNAIADGLQLVEIRDVRLDVGTFLQDVLGPIADTVSAFTDPIKPLIDFVTSNVPLLDSLGLNITWLDLAATFGDFDPGMIKAISEIINVIDIIDSVSSAGNVPLPVGDITIFKNFGGSPFTPSLWDKGLDLGQTFEQIKGTSGLITDLIGGAGGIVNALGDLANDVGLTFDQKEAAKALGGVVGGSSAGGFSFPLFENPVEQAFGLLMGKPADLVVYDLAPLEFNFDFSVFIPIFGPLGVSLGLNTAFTADTAFVYDTYGIQRFVETGFRNPLLLFEGFGIYDSPDLSGKDDPELTFNAELFATAELNLAIARAGVQASLGFEILFDLFDPNHDGKIRISEIVNNVANQLKAPDEAERLLAPLAIFDVSGQIYAELFAFLIIDFGLFSFEKEFPIVEPTTLVDFEIDFFRPPVLANEMDNGDLVLNTGTFAAQRILGVAKDVAERLEIKSVGVDGDYVNVEIKALDGALGDDADVPQSYKVKKGAKIIIDGGAGDDEFNLSMFTQDLVLFEIDGGVGNDKIILGPSHGVVGAFSVVTGGVGNDSIVGGAGSDLIYGGAGNDTITAGDGDDLVFGDDGDVQSESVRGPSKPTDGRDSISGGNGLDILIGSGESDTIEGGAHNDLILGDGGVVFFTSPAAFKSRANVKSLADGGVSETDKPLAVFNDILHGDAGADVIFAGAGNDTVEGGTENDTIFGESGFDTIDAGAGVDTVFGDAGKFVGGKAVPGGDGNDDVIHGGAGNDALYGNGGNDKIFGDAGNDKIYGGSGADVIHGDTGVEGSGDNDTIYGEGDPDKIFGDGGNDKLDGGDGPDAVNGGDGADVMYGNKSADFLDGRNGSDYYLMQFQGGAASSLIRVLDSGATVDTDVFIATGTVFADQFLLRANADGSIAFVALINRLNNAERVNYTGVERIVINGSFGNDNFAVDDTSAEITVNGEFGDDTFQIGQLYRSPRTETEANVSVDDEYATIETTRGFLSNGISKPMTINGGIGNDRFTVFHNKAVLSLYGNDGDDIFEIRAFALAGSQEPQRERTDITGGAGADLVQYVVNAPVNIDGGDGFDTVVVIGTEFGDDFVVTENGVFGAGLNVNFVNIESLRVDGAEGDDRFFVQSTSEKFVTQIFGGLGSDTFNLSGDTPPIVSNDLRGHSGVVTHDVESLDPLFAGQNLFGVSANVVDNDEPAIAVLTTDGSTIVTEGGPGDSYQIVLTRKPSGDILVKALAPLPPPDDRELRRRSFRVDSPTKFAISPEGTSVTLKFSPANWYIPQTVQVLADATVFADPAGLLTRPELGDSPNFTFNDTAAEGPKVGVVNHLVQAVESIVSGKPTSVSGVSFQDTSKAFSSELVGRKVEIISGPGAGEIRFIRAVSGNTLTLDRVWKFGKVPTTDSDYVIRSDDAIVGVPTSIVNDALNDIYTFTDTAGAFPTAGEGLTGAILEIIRGPGVGQQRLILSNTATTLTLNGVWRTTPVAGQSVYRVAQFTGLAIPSVLVEIRDNDAAGVIVNQANAATVAVGDTDSRTSVIEGSDGDQPGEQDTLEIKLSRAPTHDVTVTLTRDPSQLSLSSTALSFNSGNWNTYQTVTVSAFNDLLREGFHSSLLTFGATSGDVDLLPAQSDTFTVAPDDEPVYYVGLTQRPSTPASVTVTIDAVPRSTSLFQVAGNKVVFVDGNGDLTTVTGTIVVSYTYAVPGFAGVLTAPVLVRIQDDDAPTVLVRETDGSTDVIEVKKGGGAPESIPLAQDTDTAPWIDHYDLVVTAEPSDPVVITVTPQITKTTRTGGIRHDAVQVQISSADGRVVANPDGTLTVTFSPGAGWDVPVRVKVAAIDDAFVDGADTQVFAPAPHQVSGIQGPIVIDGAGGQGSLSGLLEPIMLPIGADGINPESNQKESTGNVHALAGTSLTVFTADLTAALPDLKLSNVMQLVGKTAEVTKGPALGQFRLITDVTVLGATTTLLLNAPYELAPDELESQITEYAITSESPTFFVREEERIDYLFVHDVDSPADSTGVLTSNRLYGLNMGPDLVIGGREQAGGVTYGALEVIEINLGRGLNNFQVLGTPKRDDGFQTWTILNTGDDILDPHQPLVKGDTVTVKLNASDQVTGTGTVSTAVNGVTNTTATLSGSYANGSLQGQLLEITAGAGSGQMRRIRSNVGGAVTLESAWETPPIGATYQIIDPADGNLAVNLGSGDDTLNAAASSLGIVVFGGLGADQITTGSGDDIVFGDRGRVDYFNEGGAIVTRLGVLRDPLVGFADVTSTATTLVDAAASFPTDYDGLQGLLVTIINGTGAPSPTQDAQRRFIAGNTATTLTINEPWDVLPDATSKYRISTTPEDQTDGVARAPGLLIAMDETLGGADVIATGAGADQIMGGAGGDTIAAGAGDDVVLGDSGRIDRTTAPDAPDEPVFGDVVASLLSHIQTTAPANGGEDIVHGGAGGDVLLGGFAADTVYGDDDAGSAGAADLDDIIVGDNGHVEFVLGVIARLYTTDTTNATGGADTLIGNAGDDWILGGVNGAPAGCDILMGSAGHDILIGDNGEIRRDLDVNLATIDLVRSWDDALGGEDHLDGNAGADWLLGGHDGDLVHGDDATGSAGAADLGDIVLADNGLIQLATGQVARIATTDTTEATGGADTVTGNAGDDILLTGVNGSLVGIDVMAGNSGDDILLGDNGELRYDLDLNLATLDLVQTLDVTLGGADHMTGDAEQDLLVGGTGSDRIDGGTQDDLLVGDMFLGTFTGNILSEFETKDRSSGASDILFGGAQNDIVVGGTGGDFADGDEGQDLVLGDAVRMVRVAGNVLSPRFQTLAGARIYTRSDLDPAVPGDQSGGILADGQSRPYRNLGGAAPPAWLEYRIADLYHSTSTPVGTFGNDYLAGGPDNDMVFGQLGNDTIQGDGSIDSAVTDVAPVLVGASRTAAGTIGLTPSLTAPSVGMLVVSPSFEAATDGDDYLEGNGGDDVIFGNLGQDDIIGGSSAMYTLVTPAQRPDGSDLIFGGAGTRIARNASVPAVGDAVFPMRHARDADTIVGDNGNIVRLVGINAADSGGLLRFHYDNPVFSGYSPTLPIIPRSVELLDYTPGGTDYLAAATSDIGARDEVHGESGDDVVHGMVGGDILYGDSDDDDVFGGYGADWISGGTGIDGVIGDDGRIYTSRNDTIGEALYGVAGFANNQLDLVISTPGKIQQATINVRDALKKTVDLTPFNLTPDGQPDDPLFAPAGANDVIYGGLGNDFLHGSAGDDALSGAEAQAVFFAAPTNPGDVLRFGDHSRAGEFFDYDEFEPLVALQPFLLNFEASEMDGDDVLFGDLGNDWIVGGQNRDHLYGGYGADLLDADDDKTTNGGLNDAPDGPLATMEDIAYGGAGRDVLIANTGGDRLIDWVGEFNSYLVPFAPFGAFTISRALLPALFDYLYDLSRGDGADPTRAADTGASPARNGEPDGELGLVNQKDPAWHDQTGGPIDPQPGNIPGGRRDVLRGADFNNGQASGFVPDVGTWEVASGRYAVAPETQGGDAVSVFYVDDVLPPYFEVQATLNAVKPIAGYKANTFLVFDYQSPKSFKFAGIDVSRDKIQIGVRDDLGWNVLVEKPAQVRDNTDYSTLLAVNGMTATIVAAGVSLSYTFSPRIDADGFRYRLNDGMVGLGAQSAKARIDNVAVQILPPNYTLAETDNFDDGVANRFTGPGTGAWTVTGGKYVGTPPASGTTAYRTVNLGVNAGLDPNSVLDLSVIVNTNNVSGIVFDRYADNDFKFVTLDPVADQVAVGHMSPKRGLVVDAVAAMPLKNGTNYTLTASLVGTTISASVDGKQMISRAFNAPVLDGGFGLLTRGGPGTFDVFSFKTDDPAFGGGSPYRSAASGMSAVASGAVASSLATRAIDDAVNAWSATPLAQAHGTDWSDLPVWFVDLPDNLLGQAREHAILIDTDAAGHGWFIPDPADPASEGNRTDAYGRYNLSYVLMHEFGHALGMDDDSGSPSGVVLSPEEILEKRMDLNRDGFISSIDALVIVNALNSATGAFEAGADFAAQWSVDVDSDTSLSPLDALLVINHLNRFGSAPIPAATDVVAGDSTDGALSGSSERGDTPSATLESYFKQLGLAPPADETGTTLQDWWAALADDEERLMWHWKA